MSDETKAALDLALRDHIAEITTGSILTDYFTIAASVDMEDIGSGTVYYCFITPDKQPAHVSMGLIQYAVTQGAPNEGDDDDD